MTGDNINKVIQIYENTILALNQVLVGQDEVKKVVAASILSDTNSKILLTSNTGMGKTTLANYLASGFNSERISVTSDMIPSDIQEQLKRNTNLNFLHIDEFNRASGKVQSTFIELFAEKQMSIMGTKYSFNDFYVLATQNSADISGIFNVPQAVYDRFDVNIYFDELTESEKRQLLFEDFKPSRLSTLLEEDIYFTKEVVDKFVLSEKDKNLLMKIFNIIDSLRLEQEKLFAGSNIRAHKFAIRLAKLNAMANGRDYILASDLSDFIKYLYMHRINQNINHIETEKVFDCFQAAQVRILSLKR